MTEKMLARVAVSSVPYAADRLYTYLEPDKLIGSAERLALQVHPDRPPALRL